MYQLDENDCDEDVDYLSPLVDIFLSKNSIRVFIAFTPLSRDEFEAIWNRIGIHMITAWSFDCGTRCKTTTNGVFLVVLSICPLTTK